MTKKTYPENYRTYHFGSNDFGLAILRLIVSNMCNLSCPYCHVFSVEGNLPDMKNKLMASSIAISSIYLYQKLLKQHHQATKPIISFYGGEVLINRRVILDVCDEFKDSSYIYIVNTNGTSICKETLLKLPREAIDFHVSMDGAEVQHNTTRHFRSGKGTYKIVAERIKLLQKFGYSVQINFMVTMSNILYLSDFADAVRKIGVKRVYFDITRDVYNKIKAVDIAKKVISLVYACARNNISTGSPFGKLFRNFPISEKSKCLEKLKNHERYPPEMYLQVEPDGNVYIPYQNGREIVARFDQIDSIYDLNSYKKAVEISRQQSEYCCGCILKDECAGELRNVWRYHHGSYAGSECACDVYRLIELTFRRVSQLKKSGGICD